MKKRFILNFCICLNILFSMTTTLATAQDMQPPEEAGVIQGEVTITPTNPTADESTTATALVFSGGPAYDSGWVPIAQDQAITLTHNLGGDTDDYVVNMQFWASSNGINQRSYGGVDYGTNVTAHAEDDRVGAYWRALTDSAITIYRRPEDDCAEKIRIRIWIDAAEDYDSHWVALIPDTPLVLNHALGGSSDDYVVDLQFRASSSFHGVNQRNFGGMDIGADPTSGHNPDDRVGAYWRTLTNANVTLYRRIEDDYAAEARVRIWVRPEPTYDSGWVLINPDEAKTLTHNIGGNVDDYIVDMQFSSSDGNGINQRYYGGNDFGAHPPGSASENDRVGAYWRSLTTSNIVIYRRADDIYCEEIRIRIWNAWKPRTPDYDSGWVAVGLDSTEMLTHTLGGSTSDYYVDMQYRTTIVDGINQRYFGGMDIGTKPTSGHVADDRVGAYWRSLTNNNITVYRRPEDDYAEEVRIRIWLMPKPDYDSGLTALATSTEHTFTHNLGGSIGDYLVDLQYYNASSLVNQRYYGGMDIGANPSTGLNENDRVGAYWRLLNTTSIEVYRRPEDTYAEQVRVRIWRIDAPDYNSSWVVMTQDEAETLTHNLGGNEQNFLVIPYQYDDSSVNYINQRFLGGCDFGAVPPVGHSAEDRVGSYWRTLTRQDITVYRRPEDDYADWVMIRIWDYTQELYLPLVVK